MNSLSFHLCMSKALLQRSMCKPLSSLFASALSLHLTCIKYCLIKPTFWKSYRGCSWSRILFIPGSKSSLSLWSRSYTIEVVLLWIPQSSGTTRSMDIPGESRLQCNLVCCLHNCISCLRLILIFSISLWQVHGVVSMGQSYTTAWGVFNTIRWGLIMVPVQALEATSNTFVGHRWGIYQQSKPFPDARASWGDLKCILHWVWIYCTHFTYWLSCLVVTAPAFKSVVIALLVECPLCLALSIKGAGPFAKYLSNSDEVAAITAMMWRSIDWCYICYGVSTQLATILLSTQTKWSVVEISVGQCICLVLTVTFRILGISISH